MRYYFNGCSHTIGNDLADRRQAWPFAVAKAQNAVCYNHAISGNSNDHMLYETVKNLHNYDKFYVAWSYHSRCTRYRSDNNHPVVMNVQHQNGTYGRTKEYQQYCKLYYKFWYNQLQSLKQWLQQILMLQSLFKAEDKQYKMIFITDNNLEYALSSRQNFQDYVKLLESFDCTPDETFDKDFAELQMYTDMFDTSQFIGWKVPDIKVETLSKQCPVGPTGHLLHQGHEKIAEYIIKHDTH